MRVYEGLISSKRLLEKKLIVYHGDNFNTTKLDPKLMNMGNNQLGVGIYFGTPEVAESYGKNIVSTEIDTKNFVNARDDFGKYVKEATFIKFLMALNKTDDELWYLLTDYGIEISDQDEVEPYHFSEIYDIMQDGEFRNVQLEIAERVNTISFVNLWNKIVKIDGAWDKDDGFYVIINTNYKLTKVK